jgi:hypothetical protein
LAEARITSFAKRRTRGNGGSVERSTRFSIVEHALGDVAERLRELEPSPATDDLRAQAHQLEAAVLLWEEHPPDEPTRIALLKRVLDLNIDIMRAGGERAKTSSEELDPDDDYPKIV